MRKSALLIRLTIERLDALSRKRALTLAESLELERAIKTADDPPGGYQWSKGQDETAQGMRRAGVSCGKIGKQVGRSDNAVAARLRYLARIEG